MTKTPALLTVLVLAASPAFVSAQAPRAAVEEQNASETRERVRQILDQYPPSLRQVLRLDPSLITRPDYMSSYPTLAAYLAQHPEVAHNPTFFLGGPGGPQYTDGRAQVASAVESIFIGMEVTVGGAGLWVAKNGVFDEAAQAMQVFAILVMSLGLGFVLSALASYGLSRQLGLVGSSHADHA